MGRFRTPRRSSDRPARQHPQHTRRRLLGIVDIERLEDRLLFSYSSAILGNLYSVAGNTWTYTEYGTAGTAAGSTTLHSVGPATFQGHNASELDSSITVGSASETTQEFFATTSAGLIDYGHTTTLTTESETEITTDSFTPDKVTLPANLTAGVPTLVTWDHTESTTIDGTVTTSSYASSWDYTLVSDTTTPLTTPAGTYDCYQVNISETETPTVGTATVTNETWYIAPNAGLVKDITTQSSGATTYIQLTDFNGAGTTGTTGTGTTTTTTSTSTTTSSTTVLAPTLSGTLPTSVIAGAPAKIAQTVTITNTGSTAYDNTAATELFLSTGTAITSSSVQLPQTITKTLKLKAGAHYVEKFALKSLPSTVPDGTYYVVAEVTDSSGNTATTASNDTITVAPPEVTLSAAFTKFASTALSGKKFKETIIVSNTAGNEAAAGTLPIVVETSPDGLTADATVLTTTSKRINLKQGKSISIPLTLTASASMNGDYLIVQIDPDNTLHSVSTTGETIASPVKLTIS